MNPFDYFDEIFCINLDKRVQRWDRAQKEFEKLGILDRVNRFSAIDKFGGKRGCFESHMKIIHMAKENNLKNVFIFEDDVAVTPLYSQEKFQKSITHLQDNTWEFFYMGGFEKRIRPRPRYYRLKKKYGLNEVSSDFDYIMKASSVGWNQSYAVNSNIFEKITDDYKNGLWEMLAERWRGKPGRTDRYYQHHLKPKAYVCVPSFTTQYDFVSDLQRTRKNRSLRISPSENKIINNKNPFDFFDGIYCINLDERTDRWDHSCEQFEKLGIRERVERFSAIRPCYDSRWDRKTPWGAGKRKYPRLGAVGCAESHKEIIRLSMEQNFKNVLVFEDDFDVCDGWDKNLKSALRDLENLPWDLFYLGYHLHKAGNMIRPDWKNLSRIISKRNRGIHRTLSLAYNQKSFNFLYENINSFDFKRFGRNGHVDKFYSRCGKLKKFFVNPEVVKPNENFKSDIA